jgi:hypothetical protein
MSTFSKFCAVAAAVSFAASVQAADPIVNGQFTTGLGPWTAAPSTTGSAAGTCGFNDVTSPGVETLTGTAGFPALGASTTRTALGSVSLTANGFRSCVLYQDVAIPAGATTAVLTMNSGTKVVGGLSTGDTAIFAGLYATTDVPNFNVSTTLAGTTRLIIGGAAGTVLAPRTSVVWNVSTLAGTTVRVAIMNAMQSTGGGTGAFIAGAGSIIGVGDVQLNVTVPTPAPTLDEWAKLTFAALLACLGIFYMRRRQR